MVVNGLGDELQKVSLNGSASSTALAMNKHYALYIQPDLLAKWEADPLSAPGHRLSSWSPDRIDTTSVSKNKDGTYTIEGNIIELQNGATTTHTSNSIPVRFVLTKGPDGWQITGYQKL